MAKTGFTEEKLASMGLVKNSDGTYSKAVNNFKVFDHNENDLCIKEKIKESKDFNFKPITEWFITYNVPSKKNSRINFVSKGGKQVSIPSKLHSEYVKVTAMQYEVFGMEFRNTIKKLGLKKPYRVEFTFVRKSKHRSDFSNLLQSVEDLMVSNNWIEDDDMNTLLPSFKPRQDNPKMPGVHIKLITE